MIDFGEHPLSAFEARVLGVLAEKQSLTPDIYPLSLNAITNGANQLSNREPVMQLTDATVESCLKSLQEKKLVRTYFPVASRVAKYEHMLREVFSLDDAHAAVLTALLLRGPQTPGELRQRTARMYPFASTESVERSLTDLAGAAPPLVVKLARAPGEKEARWTHLFAGAANVERQDIAAGFSGAEYSSGAVESVGDSRIEKLSAEVTELRREVDYLRGEFERFKKQFE